jgi:hypothetical protein
VDIDVHNRKKPQQQCFSVYPIKLRNFYFPSRQRSVWMENKILFLWFKFLFFG